MYLNCFVYTKNIAVCPSKMAKVDFAIWLINFEVRVICSNIIKKATEETMTIGLLYVKTNLGTG